ncbi:MAG: hypothetical protein IJH12_02905 [Clostridia bacterium]|nr:hypothetical protein [Clostridia bacterium]
MKKMNYKISNKVLVILGFIPIIWLSLLLAPLLDGGIPKILQEFGTLMENPFKITFTKK